MSLVPPLAQSQVKKSTPPTVLLFKPEDTAVRPALEKWRSQTTNERTQRAIDMALRDGE